MQLETERLVLRELTSLDFDALYAVLGDSDIMQHYPYTFDETRVRRWIQKNQERYHVFGFGLWAVVLKETGELIGDCGLTMQNVDGVILPEIGYHIAKAHQRRGYAREAARACRDWGLGVSIHAVPNAVLIYETVEYRLLSGGKIERYAFPWRISG